MAFADEKSLRDRSAGIGGVVVVHAGLAALLVLGLSTEVTKQIFTGPLPTREFKDPPPPPPPEPPKPQPRQQAPANPVVTPPVPIPMPPKPNLFETTIELPPLSDDLRLTPLPKGPIEPPAPPAPAFDPVPAMPRNDAASWVTDNDYKSRWIREGMTGTARFRLEIAANGRVSDCRITQSSGHSALDEATCSLITKRARFNAAKDGSGAKTTGSFSSSIRWQLPN
ncbi:outer membrane transport energization protein TonB [Altererythrobacter xiamenensis]|uniref:Outer membrane transport energization protein TonB n=1 Tax=Altererythrobacter xiamenensis TaxID=1316679 RepID=A0A1Y6EJL4_9SPHN|nr:energy transducer TonB [Altererythrobacter xiamenensis]SMQ61140.1 outer membrane transport energization protein TonB [Altererythrobacter xiamenensis]